MSVTREVLIDSAGPIEQLAQELNAALVLDVPLTIQKVGSASDSWLIAEGRAGPYPLVLMDAMHLDAETRRGLGWILELHCGIRPGEAYSAYDVRCDADAVAMMQEIATALRTRCVALSNLQSFLGEAP